MPPGEGSNQRNSVMTRQRQQLRGIWPRRGRLSGQRGGEAFLGKGHHGGRRERRFCLRVALDSVSLTRCGFWWDQ